MSDPITVIISEPSAPIVVTVPAPAEATTVIVTEAADAYQLAVADGFVGTRTEWLASLVSTEPGPQGIPAEIVICASLAAYQALAPEVQMDGRFYVVPTA